MSLSGIDVSSAQSVINTGKLQADFVIVKATQGTYYRNPYYSNQIKSADSAGKKLGIYHFIDNNNDVKKQADYFLATVKPYIGKAVLVLDFEDDSKSGTYIQNQSGVDKGKQWLDYVYQQTGVRPLLYTGVSCENSLD